MKFEKIRNDIYSVRVPTPYIESSINVYLFLGNDGVDAIDIGPYSDRTLETLAYFFDELKIKFSDMRNIYLTHGHEDHGGLGEYFSRNFSTNIYIHSKDAVYYRYCHGSKSNTKRKVCAYLSKLGVPENLLDELYTYIHTQWPVYKTKFINFKYLDEITTIRAGNHEVNVVYTPGHTPGSVCYYISKEKFLFTGDTILSNTTANPGSILSMDMLLIKGACFENPLQDLMNSLKLIRKIPVKHLFPSHGRTNDDKNTLVERYLTHHEKRLKEIVSILKQNGASTCFQLCRKIFKSIGDRDLFLQLLEMEVHLISLEYGNKVKKVDVARPSLPCSWALAGSI